MMMFYLAAIETEEDKQKFTYLYEKFAVLLLKKAEGYTDDTYLCQTLVHEVFVKIATKINSIKINGNYETLSYLEAMLCNEYKSHLEKTTKESMTFEALKGCSNTKDELELDEIVFNKHMVNTAISALENMNATRRFVFISRFVTDLSFSDIAMRLDLKEDNCRKIYQRARKDLLELLEAENGKQTN